MMLRFLLTLALLLIPIKGSAQQIAVHSGEHPGFTRLVIMLPRGADWNTTQGPDTVVLHMDRTRTYDLSDVFRAIPRDRIMDVQQNTAGLTIQTQGTVHPQIFQLPGGPLVVDIVDGPPTSTSPAPETEDALASFWVRRPPPMVDKSGPIREAPTAQPPHMPLPDPRVSQAEQALLRQLSRATAQGIFHVDPQHRPDLPALSGGDTSDGKTDSHLAIRSETVIDRDMGNDDPAPQMLANGLMCAPDAKFDLRAWIDERPVSEQLADARSGLVGEFDTPQRDAILGLVKTYLALGFSAEARATLVAFNLQGTEAAELRYMADVLEGVPTAPTTQIPHMSACAGKVALWALMGADPLPAKGDVNLGAVQRGFSDLPPVLRDMLGPDLVHRMIALGAVTEAGAITNAFRRLSSDTEGTGGALATAELALARGDGDGAQRNLAKVTQARDARAAIAISMLVDARIAAAKVVDDATIANAEDLSHALGSTTEGMAARHAVILGQGSVGRFALAFDSLSTWPEATEPDLRSATRRTLFDLLARVPDDGVFLTHALPGIKEIGGTGLAPARQIALSERLSALGFPAQAAGVLDAPTRQSAPGRLALARSALADHDGAAAVAYLEGLDGVNAAGLRAEALSLLGEHLSAAEAFAQQGDMTRAGQEAWRGGDWSRVMQNSPTAQRDMVKAAGLGDRPEDRLHAQTDGPLARSTALIAGSQTDRAVIDALLRQTPAP